jgi:hypothetical protein
MFVLLPVIAALTALLIVPGLLFHFDVTPKMAVLLFGTALCCLDLTSVRRSLGALWNSATGRLLLFILAAQWLSLMFSSALSSQIPLSLAGSEWRRFGFVTQTGLFVYTVLLAGWLASDAANLRSMLRITAGAGVITAVYGCLQYLGWDPLQPVSAYLSGEAEWTIVRPPSTLGHAGYFATFQLYAVFASLGLLYVETRPVLRWMAGVAAVLGCVAIVLSGTRSALGGLLVGGLAWLVWRRPRLSRKQWALAAAGIVALGLFYASPAGLRLRWRTRWYVDDASGGARLFLWRDTARMAAARIAGGYGPETFSNQFPRHQSIELARAYPDTYQESPHNVFLDVLVSQGLGGLAAFAALCLLVITAIRRSSSADIQALGCGFIAGLVSQQFLCFTVPTAVFFYASAAVAIVGGRENKTTRTAPILATAPFVAVALVVVVFAGRLLLADRAQAEVKDALAQSDLETILKRYEREDQLRLPGGNFDLYYARAMLNLSGRQADSMIRFRTWQHAIGAATAAASALEDRPNALVNLAAFRSTFNDPALVESTLRTATLEAPNWYRPHWLLARLYLLTGSLDKAEIEARSAAERNGGHNPEVQQTLQQVLAARVPHQ